MVGLMRTALALAAALALAGCAAPVDTRHGAEPKKDPRQLSELYVKIAAEHLKAGRNELALNRLNKALELDPRNALAHSTLGVLYERLGESEKAERHLRRAVELAPEDAAVLNNYGQFLCRSGRHQEGLALFARALEDPLYRTPEFAHTNAGLCALRAGDRQAAERHFRAALKTNPRFPVALREMARLTLEDGRYLSARGYLQRYLEVAQHTAETLWMGVQIERALGDQDAAASYALLLRSRFPDSEEAHALEAQPVP